MSKTDYRVIDDPRHGYKRLDPIPADGALGAFYESQYYDLIRRGGRAPEIRRLMAGGAEAASERGWLTATQYEDIRFLIERYAPGRRVLDVGCGIGDLLAFLKEQRFDPTGIEPSAEASAAARKRGLKVQTAVLEDFVREHEAAAGAPGYDAVILASVLEHVPDPMRVLALAHRLLREGGCLVVHVPNDFSEMQAAAHRQRGGAPWWVAAPDHINYFNFHSLGVCFEKSGYAVVHTQGDFPMELFLLMGESYIGDPELGRACHQKRVRFEMALEPDFRRRIYQALAAVGVGRAITMVGRKEGA